jgi:hypothetical protein
MSLVPFAPFFTADKWKGRRMKEELRSESKGLRSLQGGDENRGQLFALLPAGIGHVQCKVERLKVKVERLEIMPRSGARFLKKPKR